MREVKGEVKEEEKLAAVVEEDHIEDAYPK